MNQYIFLLALIIISIWLSFILIPNEPEGFTTYFRQTIRPHIRMFRSAQDNVTYHFNTKFKDFGRRLGFF
jgi:cell shape-determining protein MreC